VSTESPPQPIERDLVSLTARWPGTIVMQHDRPTGSWIFIALHSDVLGRPAGGTRLRIYPSPLAALQDAMHLAEGMTRLGAFHELPYGGGHAVIAVPILQSDGERLRLLERYGDLVRRLNGTFTTRADFGTGPKEMLIVASRTRWVHGFYPSTGDPLDPGPYTAVGVRGGIRAALRHRFGSPEVKGRRIVVEGLGRVGEPLARALAEEGARLTLADLDQHKTVRLARELDADTTLPDEALSTECDVYAPCAVSPLLGAETISQLKCLAVVGAGRRFLPLISTPLLHERGWTQKELCDRSKAPDGTPRIQPTTVSEWLRKRAHPSSKAVWVVCEALEIPRSQLYAIGEQLWEIALTRQAEDRRRRMVEELDTDAIAEALAGMTAAQVDEVARLVAKRRETMSYGTEDPDGRRQRAFPGMGESHRCVLS